MTDGDWIFDADAQKDFTFSEEFFELLKSNSKAFSAFAALPASHQKQYTQWGVSAKKPETQIRGIEKMI